MSHCYNFVIPVVALVVAVTGVTNLSLQVHGDSIVEMVDWVSFSCRLYMQSKLIKLICIRHSE